MTVATTREKEILSQTAEAVGDNGHDLPGHIPAKIDYVRHPLFSNPRAEEELFGREIKLPRWSDPAHAPDEGQAPRRRSPRLSAKDERALFLRYNYCRYRLSALIEAQRKYASPGRARQMALWYKRAMKTRAAIVRANMALVVAMAKHSRVSNVEFGELVSEGNMALLRSIDKFDVSRGFKFSTYACRAVLKSIGRLAVKTERYRQHFPAHFDPQLERSDHAEKVHEMQQARSADALRQVLQQNRAQLNKTEFMVIMERFAIGSEGKGKTFAELGRMVGLSKERVRQVQEAALSKIRYALQEYSLC